MKELSKERMAQRDKFVEELHAIELELDTADTVVLNSIEAANATIDKYNAKLREVETWRDEITADMENYYDEKSEKWQEGDAGSEYSEWKDEWNGFDTSELDKIEELNIVAVDHANQLEALPITPG